MVHVTTLISTLISLWITLGNIQTTESNSSPPQNECFFKPFYPKNPPVPKSGKCKPPPPKKCDPNSYYYTLDGSCNNLKNPQYGQVPSLMGFFVDPQYENGYDSPRKMSNGKSLPDARLFTLKIFKPTNDYNTPLNSLYYGFSQYTTHDSSFQTPITETKPCCVNGKPSNPMPKDCDICKIGYGDPFYHRFKITCLTNTRTVDTKYQNCTDVKVNHAMNYQTPALEQSILYGTGVEIASIIRSKIGGLLKTNSSNNDGSFIYPAQIPRCPFGGLTPQPNTPCYVQTDSRTMQNTELMMQYLYWFTYHNVICKELIKLNPSWNDEKLYQECRRINIAVYQHAFYSFIVVNIGIAAASKYGLLPKTSGYKSGYTDTTATYVSNEMSSTFGRHGHSNVREDFLFGGLPYRTEQKYFNMGFIQGNKSGAMKITDMFISKSCQRQDNWIVEALNNKLFADPSGKVGADLSCIDMMRGRQYGQPGYNEYRKICGLSEVTTWAQFYNITVDPSVMKDLEQLYPNPATADLYTMGLLEKKCGDSSLGPTYTCLLAAQYWLLIFTDRFWYDFPTAKFSTPQLNAIRKTNMSTVLCSTITSLKQVPKNAFYIASKDNPLISCEGLRNVLDLSPWKEKPSHGS